jgi:hypothetical protein
VPQGSKTKDGVNKDGVTEHLWLKQRSSAINAASSGVHDGCKGQTCSSSSSSSSDSSSSADSLPAGAKKEIEFQKQKLAKRRAEASDLNTLLPHETTDPATMFSIQDIREKQEKTDRDRMRRQANLDAVLNKTPQSLLSFRGKLTYIDSGVETLDLRTRLANMGILRTDSRLGANLFLVPDPGKPSMRITWVAVLTGCSITSPSFFQLGRGPIVAYHAALLTKAELEVRSVSVHMTTHTSWLVRCNAHSYMHDRCQLCNNMHSCISDS